MKSKQLLSMIDMGPLICTRAITVKNGSRSQNSNSRQGLASELVSKRIGSQLYSFSNTMILIRNLFLSIRLPLAVSIFTYPPPGFMIFVYISSATDSFLFEGEVHNILHENLKNSRPRCHCVLAGKCSVIHLLLPCLEICNATRN